MEEPPMSDDATIRGHEQIVEETIGLIRSLPIPPGVDLRLPPPSTKALGIRFEEYVPARSFKATVVVSEDHVNGMGLLEGGFIAAMFDNLIAGLSYLTARGPATSLELTTHFLRPVFVGARLTLDAVVRKAGRTAIYIAAEAHNEDDKLVATAMSTVQVLPMPTS
jgi:uncharacterized protein (TIGR00369 family)